MSPLSFYTFVLKVTLHKASILPGFNPTIWNNEKKMLLSLKKMCYILLSSQSVF